MISSSSRSPLALGATLFASTILLGGVLACSTFGPSLPARERENPATGMVECGPKEVRQRSPVVTAGEGRNRVYAEVVALAGEAYTLNHSRDTYWQCRISWIVHLSTDSGSTYSSHAVPGLKNHIGDVYFHEFEVVGWSEDGAYVLGLLIWAAGDYTNQTPVVIDTETVSITARDLEPYFLKWLDEDNPPEVKDECTYYLDFGGFTSGNEVAFDLHLFSFDPPSPNPCTGVSHWRWKPGSAEPRRVKDPGDVYLERRILPPA